MPSVGPIRGLRWRCQPFFRQMESVTLSRSSTFFGRREAELPDSLPVGTAVILDCGTLGRAAVVRWLNDGCMGLSFDSELNLQEVSALTHRSSALGARMKTRE